MAIASPCCNLSNSNFKSCGLNSLTTTGFFTSVPPPCAHPKRGRTRSRRLPLVAHYCAAFRHSLRKGRQPRQLLSRPGAGSSLPFYSQHQRGLRTGDGQASCVPETAKRAAPLHPISRIDKADLVIADVLVRAPQQCAQVIARNQLFQLPCLFAREQPEFWP